ncbi:hypothetical protein [Amycolatopsis albispora]|nr:hypothetical protein [Amycolatopsis albispora]
MFLLPEGLHGVHLRHELVTAIGDERVRAALTQGWLAQYSAAVLVERRRAAEFPTRAATGLLHAGPGAALTGESVLALAGFASASTAQVEVLVPDEREVRRRPGLVVHSTPFSEIDVDVHDGLRTMTPDFALAEVLCRDRGRVGFACLDEALARCRADRRAGLRASVLARIMARPDTLGRARARFLVDLATGLAESPAESWARLLVVDAGWPPPQPQFVVRGFAGRPLYQLDMAWPEARVAIDCSAATPASAATTTAHVAHAHAATPQAAAARATIAEAAVTAAVTRAAAAQAAAVQTAATARPATASSAAATQVAAVITQTDATTSTTVADATTNAAATTAAAAEAATTTTAAAASAATAATAPAAATAAEAAAAVEALTAAGAPAAATAAAAEAEAEAADEAQAAARAEYLHRRGWTVFHLTAADFRDPTRFLTHLGAALTQGGVAA